MCRVGGCRGAAADLEPSHVRGSYLWERRNAKGLRATRSAHHRATTRHCFTQLPRQLVRVVGFVAMSGGQLVPSPSTGFGAMTGEIMCIPQDEVIVTVCL
jgi:hypothetical protein